MKQTTHRALCGFPGEDRPSRAARPAVIATATAILFLSHTPIVESQSRRTTNTNPVARLVYADNFDEVEILDFTGEPVGDPDFDTELLIGFAIRTRRSTAELQLVPNGSAIHIGADTLYKLEELQGLSNTRVNSSALIRGTIRTAAAVVSGANYRIRTASTALGVRGTDFVVSVDEQGRATVIVDSGVVELYNPATGATRRVPAGDAVIASEWSYRAVSAADRTIRSIRERSQFVYSDADAVPRDVVEDYTNTFDYFADLESEAYAAFFASDDYFADSQEYIERFRTYYEAEMDNFAEYLQQEDEAFQEFKDAEEDPTGWADREQDDFEAFLRRQRLYLR